MQWNYNNCTKDCVPSSGEPWIPFSMFDSTTGLFQIPICQNKLCHLPQGLPTISGDPLPCLLYMETFQTHDANEVWIWQLHIMWLLLHQTEMKSFKELVKPCPSASLSLSVRHDPDSTLLLIAILCAMPWLWPQHAQPFLVSGCLLRLLKINELKC